LEGPCPGVGRLAPSAIHSFSLSSIIAGCAQANGRGGLPYVRLAQGLDVMARDRDMELSLAPDFNIASFHGIDSTNR
jgi:hypothetical protein